MSMKLPPGVPIGNIPLVAPPPGQKSNFNVPAHAWIARQRFGLDDALCLVATAGSIVHSALLFANVKLGYG
ncbi:hypothetical protein K505DRAFT_364584 [Melanomma pulvis-pyrius CBS 109.77]|uniref:Uncharacterized protein n=1 Tax=Melanomma pulvis-pyrius CBS 109.77 TaxID=1314802 RepID=A0A6A6X3T3_9PLEO|nr:hypothetical protein K505DRAFT_364584 [Melanomma pulvis-pyrius CBS 109.77]